MLSVDLIKRNNFKYQATRTRAIDFENQGCDQSSMKHVINEKY